MTITNNLIYTCPFCSSKTEIASMGSGNTFGAIFWSDNKMDAPMMMSSRMIIKCDDCNKYYVRYRYKPENSDRVGGGGYGVYKYEQAKEALFQLEEEGYISESEELDIKTWFLNRYHDQFNRGYQNLYSKNSTPELPTNEDKKILTSILSRLIYLLQNKIKEIEEGIEDQNRPYRLQGYLNHRIDVSLFLAECHRELGNFEIAKEILENDEVFSDTEEEAELRRKQIIWHIYQKNKSVFRIMSQYEFEELSGTSKIPEDAKLEDIVGNSKEDKYRRKVIIGRKSLSMMKRIKQDYYNLRWNNIRELMSNDKAADYFTKSCDDEYRHKYYLKYSFKGSVMNVDFVFDHYSENGEIEFWTYLDNDDVRVVEFSLLMRLAVQDMNRDTVRADADLIGKLTRRCASVFRVYASTIEETYDLYCKLLDYFDDETNMPERIDRAMMILWPYEAGLINDSLGWKMITKHGSPNSSKNREPIDIRKHMMETIENLKQSIINTNS